MSGEGLVDRLHIPLLEHYFRAERVEAPLDAEVKVLVRDSGERIAGADP